MKGLLNVVVPQSGHSVRAEALAANTSAERKPNLPSKLSLPNVDFEVTLDELIEEVNKEMLHSVQKMTERQSSLVNEVENLTHELRDADSLMKFKQEIFIQSHSIHEMENEVTKLKKIVSDLKRKAQK